jgi:hypothetical protein
MSGIRKILSDAHRPKVATQVHPRLGYTAAKERRPTVMSGVRARVAAFGADARPLLDVRPNVVEVVRHHGAFTARRWLAIAPGDDDPRNTFAAEPWFTLACQFVDDWDMQSFDPDYDSLPLEHFATLVRRRVTGP